MQQAGGTDGYRLALDGLTHRIADKLGLALVGARARTEPAAVQIIMPGAKQIGGFRKLAFGDGVQEPRYRPVPTYQRGGAYADPFFYYYYDPYYDFMSWVMLDSMLYQHTWQSPNVLVVSPAGDALGTGSELAKVTDRLGRPRHRGRRRRRRGHGGGKHPELPRQLARQLVIVRRSVERGWLGWRHRFAGRQWLVGRRCVGRRQLVLVRLVVQQRFVMRLVVRRRRLRLVVDVTTRHRLDAWSS